MTTPPAGSLNRMVAVLTLAVAALLWAPAAAFGHASEVRSSPAAGEILDTAPSEVRIDYDSALLEAGAALVVRSADEESITTGPAVVGDREFSVPVDPSVGPGEYSVAYRVVSKDGHTIENAFTYVVIGEAPAAIDASASPESAPEAAPEEDLPTPDSTPEAIVQESVEADVPSPTPDLVGAPADDSVMPFLLFGGVGLVIVIGIVGAVVLRK